MSPHNCFVAGYDGYNLFKYYWSSTLFWHLATFLPQEGYVLFTNAYLMRTTHFDPNQDGGDYVSDNIESDIHLSHCLKIWVTFQWMVIKLIQWLISAVSYDISLRLISPDFVDDKSTLVQVMLFVSLLSHSWLIHFFHLHMLYQPYLGLCQALCVQSHQRQPMSAVAITACEVQVSAADSQTVPTVVTGVSKPLCCRLTLTFTLTSVPLDYFYFYWSL